MEITAEELFKLNAGETKEIAKLKAINAQLLAALKDMVQLWDENHPEDPCACESRAPDDITTPGPCELCAARIAIRAAEKEG